MQMQIGTFRFEVATTEYAELARTYRRRWAARQRHGRPEALEDLGRQADTITLTGVAWIQRAADREPFEQLLGQAGLRTRRDRSEPPTQRELSADADAQPLHVYLGGGDVDSGEYAGRWVVNQLRTRDRDLRLDGIPARIEFTVQLTEYVE